MKSGMLAAESIVEELVRNERRHTKHKALYLEKYPEKIKDSWIHEELYKARNIKPAFAKWGMIGGVLYTGLDSLLLRGKAPWTLKHPHPDHEATKPKDKVFEIDYPKPDGVLTFDLLTNLTRSGVNHNENQPIHLKLKDPLRAVKYNLPKYAAPETRYCPAGVYEIVEETNGPRLQINAQNCIHCKTCDIKDPTQNINWTTPEGGGGPAYGSM